MLRRLPVVVEEDGWRHKYDRPTTRGDCLAGGMNEARPCPWVSCRHHLYLDIARPNARRQRGVHINHPGEPETMTESCSLDVADRGEITLIEVGEIFGGLTRQRIEQIEKSAAMNLRTHPDAKPLLDAIRDGGFVHGTGWTLPEDDEHGHPSRTNVEEDADVEFVERMWRRYEERTRAIPSPIDGERKDLSIFERSDMTPRERHVARRRGIVSAYRLLALAAGERPSFNEVAAKAGLRGPTTRVTAWIFRALCAAKNAGEDLPFFEVSSEVRMLEGVPDDAAEDEGVA